MGGLVAGPLLGWLTVRLMGRVTHIPSAIILQFVSTFGIWILAERLGLSAILTTVSYAVPVARSRGRVGAWARRIEIGDDAYHAVEEQLDWLEMTTGPAEE